MSGHAASGIRQEEGVRAIEHVRCPDCDAEFTDREAFVAHREAEHPPRPLSVAGAGGIESQESVSALGG